jgi:hypothetical protein
VPESTFLIAAVVGAAVLLIGVLFVLTRLFASAKVVSREPTLTSVDYASLSNAPPAHSRIRLELYNVPVRLAAVVIASAGRDDRLPEDIPKLLDEVCPGLGRVCELDKPSIVKWPPQLSTQGFARRFFINAPLPGDKGKGTPWCSVAGRIDSNDKSALVGLMFHAASANNLSQVVIERTTQWLDVLRVRHDLETKDF